MPSSVIADYTYDDESETLFVRFRPSGRLYAYLEVLLETVAALDAATSKGRYFNARIRDAFAFVAIEPSDPISRP
ncbi:KTSC domain-containing protein [Arsenicitalea aurantiaca]|uniref:KTSC domain-containing protein n=1 Tax=Arsenicitalea aurantiaca TaxID=1783274 RepID=A0A433XAB2_9HYPH|nr:KTSC domain-containing protein [Arsenicitalea aurantiaca]RUT31009.1 KTSC domain-containing protein [Arsenicitalea aurantiaca]